MTDLPTSAPLLLAFDTSGATGSVAVGRGGAVIAHARLERRTEHASQLVPAIGDVLERADVDRGELGGFVVGEGPGSFTGVRVAAATAKGLVHALARPLWAISSLAATALSVQGSGVRYVLVDARADRVYAACYGIGAVGVETLVPPHAGTLRAVLAGDVPAGAVFLGDGADRHRRVIEGAGFEVLTGPATYPDARGLLRYLGLHPDTEPVSAVDRWEPRYIRDWQPTEAAS